MAKDILALARKLAKAINCKYGAHLVINVTMFYTVDGEEVKMKAVKDAYYDGSNYMDSELFKSASSVYTCLFLKDLMDYMECGKWKEPDNHGYRGVFMKRNGMASLEYMKARYVDGIN